MASSNDPAQKWGSEHASGMLRQGLRELRGALYPESNVAQPTELGVFGTKTPGEVAEARRGDDRDMEDESTKERNSILGERLKQAADRPEPQQDDRPMEPDR